MLPRPETIHQRLAKFKTKLLQTAKGVTSCYASIPSLICNMFQCIQLYRVEFKTECA